MAEILRGYLSGNGIRKTPIVGELSPDMMEEGCYIGRFCWNGEGVAVGQRFTLALADGRVYRTEVEQVEGKAPVVVWFRTCHT
jgi:hypothetical protein